MLEHPVYPDDMDELMRELQRLINLQALSMEVSRAAELLIVRWGSRTC